MKADLTDAEFDTLDELLERTPEPLLALDALMLDGYLCGVLVQPRLVPLAEWLPPVFDTDGGTLPADADPAWLAGCAGLIERRYAALNAALAEDGWFDPLLLDPEQLPPRSEYEPEVPDSSRAIAPWASGFAWALECFPDLLGVADDGIALALARIHRHLPADNDEQREMVATLEREHPLASHEAAVEDLVYAVADLWEMTCDARFRVATIQRETPKVGRNDPCPCGSGRKWKQCHGRTA